MFFRHHSLIVGTDLHCGPNNVIVLTYVNMTELFIGAYKKLLKERREWYKNIKEIYCPILKENIVFNSKGFHHLVYPNGKMRPIKEQMYKLGLLPLAIPVIKNATKVFRYEKCFVKDLGKEAEFWTLKEFAGVQGTLTSVILRRIGTGNITFFSIMKKKDRRMICKIKKTPSGRRWSF